MAAFKKICYLLYGGMSGRGAAAREEIALQKESKLIHAANKNSQTRTCFFDLLIISLTSGKCVLFL